MWSNEFWNRMEAFRTATRRDAGDTAVSIKVRVTSGCFHREHSPRGYALIDDALHRIPESERSFEFLEHESGPEILVYVAAVTAGVSLAKSVIDLVVSVLRARSEGIKKGDRPADPVELIVRRSVERERVDEELVLRAGHSETIRPGEIEERLLDSLRTLLRGQEARSAKTSMEPSRKSARKRRRSGR